MTYSPSIIIIGGNMKLLVIILVLTIYFIMWCSIKVCSMCDNKNINNKEK